jgi:hypothetical protein
MQKYSFYVDLSSKIVTHKKFHFDKKKPIFGQKTPRMSPIIYKSRVYSFFNGNVKANFNCKNKKKFKFTIPTFLQFVEAREQRPALAQGADHIFAILGGAMAARTNGGNVVKRRGRECGRADWANAGSARMGGAIANTQDNNTNRNKHMKILNSRAFLLMFIYRIFSKASPVSKFSPVSKRHPP